MNFMWCHVGQRYCPRETVVMQSHIVGGEYLKLAMPSWEHLTKTDVDHIEELLALQMRACRAFVAKRVVQEQESAAALVSAYEQGRYKVVDEIGDRPSEVPKP